MKLLPFDLQRALAGDKVVTRDGCEVTQLTRFNCAGVVLVGVVNGYLQTWYEGGKYSGIDRDSGLDLFMPPKTVKRWVNFYQGYSYSYNSKDEATWAASETAIAIAVPVEFEEGYGCE